jgi:lipopolysaccharide/colanic/teichoic acid biosynthesis glycosyltransferase
LIGLRDVSIQGFNMIMKRALDLLLTIVVSPLVLVLSAIIAIAIKLDSRGSIVFAQTRVGANGRHFKVYKFRTMVEDAEARKAALITQNEADGPIFKIRNDRDVPASGNCCVVLASMNCPNCGISCGAK